MSNTYIKMMNDRMSTRCFMSAIMGRRRNLSTNLLKDKGVNISFSYLFSLISYLLHNDPAMIFFKLKILPPFRHFSYFLFSNLNFHNINTDIQVSKQGFLFALFLTSNSMINEIAIEFQLQ